MLSCSTAPVPRRAAVESSDSHRRRPLADLAITQPCTVRPRAPATSPVRDKRIETPHRGKARGPESPRPDARRRPSASVRRRARRRSTSRDPAWSRVVEQLEQRGVFIREVKEPLRREIFSTQRTPALRLPRAVQRVARAQAGVLPEVRRRWKQGSGRHQVPHEERIAGRHDDRLPASDAPRLRSTRSSFDRLAGSASRRAADVSLPRAARRPGAVLIRIPEAAACERSHFRRDRALMARDARVGTCSVLPGARPIVKDRAQATCVPSRSTRSKTPGRR